MNKNRHINNATILTLSLFSLTALSAVVLSSPISFADTSAATSASITVSSACSLYANTTIAHTTTILPGHEDTEIGNTTMTVECNDASGSAVYAIGFSNDTWKNTDMIDTSTNNTIPTGTGTSSSNWSMKLSIPSGNTAPTIRNDATYDFTDYEVVPSDYALVATFSSTSDGVSNSSFSTTYRAYVAATQAPGTYVGKVKYTLVHPGNAEAPVEPEISNCDTNTPYMQDWDDASSLTEEETIYLRDKRDEQCYSVAKLKDGKVWMTTNLNLAGGTALSKDDTDVTETYINGFTTQGNLTKDNVNKTITLPASSTKNSDNNYLVDDTQFTNNAYAYVFNSGNNSSSCDSNTPCSSYYSWIAATLGGKRSDGSTAEARDGYNAAASICPKGWRLPTGTTSNAAPRSSSNWKTGDTYALATAYGENLENLSYTSDSSTFYDNAGPGTTPSFMLTGFLYSGMFSWGSDGGWYWLATSYDDSNAYHFVFKPNSMKSVTPTDDKEGNSVRCIKR